MKSLVIGSRGSQLALWQAHHIAGRLEALGIPTRIQVIKTTGDQMQTASLTLEGGKGLFTKEIEEALIGGGIDLAVHSLKDLPTEHPRGLVLAAIPEREDPRDALVGKRLADLPLGARIGTSSSRRRAQLLLLRPDLTVEPVRGNVDTRLRKLAAGQYDAIALAAAGLKRLGLDGHIAQLFEPAEFCPAPGQGALAVQTRANDEAFASCSQLDHAATAAEVRAERAALSALGGGCQLPIGAFARVEGDRLSLLAAVFSPDGTQCLRANHTGSAATAEQIGIAAAAELLARGAQSLLSSEGLS
jgi:hydroxymethylbilane synthase